MASNFREEVERVSPPPFLGEWGSLFLGIVFGLTGDSLLEAMSVAHRSPWLLDEQSPDDVLGLIGRERRLPRYPSETNDQYRARLHGAWDAYKFAGDESSILGQLTTAGFGGAEIYDAWQWPTRGEPGHWSQFWVFFPAGTHTVNGIPVVGGGWVIGDGTLVGVEGITIEQVTTIRGIIRKWKPVQWVCRGVIFEISGWTVGDGHDVGESDLEIGGEQASIGA